MAGMIIGITLGAALVLLILAVVLRAAAFKPKEGGKPAPEKVEVDGDAATDHLAQMVRCKTVSNRIPSLAADPAEFEKFRELLKTLYPTVHEKCSLKRVGPSGILYHLPGKSAEKPSVFMAHYDVVPANEEAWKKPAFDGLIEDGVLWGRGTLDTKITLLGVMESAEALLKKGFVPENDMYFSFSGDEEIAGDSAPAIVEELKSMGVTPMLVVDEGGAVVEGLFPGVTAPCALIGTGEKGMMDMEFIAQSKGGHASAPPPHTLVGELSQTCVNIEGKPFPSKLTPPAAEMFDTLGRHSTFVYRMIFANLWLFRPVLDALCKKKGGELNALMRTTVAFTCMEGSKGTNVLPPKARMVANLRLIGGDTMESATEYLTKLTGGSHVKLNMMYGMNPSKFSATDSESYRKVRDAISQVWTDAIVSPYLMVACSDSRHFCRISDHVYRFSAMALTAEERGLIHGNDERIPLTKIAKCVEFYTHLLKSC